jgi:hypothetical protein
VSEDLGEVLWNQEETVLQTVEPGEFTDVNRFLLIENIPITVLGLIFVPGAYIAFVMTRVVQ